MNRISLKEVFKNAGKVYQGNTKVLLKLSAFQILLSYVTIMSSVVIARIPQEKLGLILLAGLLRLVYVVFAAYFTNRMYVALVLASKSVFNGAGGGVRQFYREAGPVTWRFIGYRLLLGLIYTLPVILIIIGIVMPSLEGFEIPISVSVIFCLIGGIPLLLLMLLFYFVLAITVVYRYPKSIFGYSIKLLKGNISAVFVLVCVGGLSAIGQLLFAYLVDINSYGLLGQAGLYLLEMIPIFLLMPFFVSLPVIAMQMIEESYPKDIVANPKNIAGEEKKEFDYLQ